MTTMFSISGQIFDQKPSHIIPLLFLLGLAWIVAKTLYLAFFSPLRHVPGPTLAKITRLWELWTLRQGSFHSKLVELHSKHGPVVRIAPNRYSFDATADLKKIYSSTADFPKSEFYHAWRPPGEENLLTFRNKKDHASRKRPIAQLYSMTHLRNYEEAVDKMNAVLLEKLDQYGRSGELVDLPDISQLYALDVIGYITMGESFNVLERGRKGNVLLQKIENNPKYSVQAGLFPELHPWFYYLTKPFATPTARITADTATTKIQEFRNGGISSDESLGFESFLSKLIRMEDAGKVDSLSSFDAVGSNIFAGSDTTGITLSAAFYLLYTNPEKLRKLRDEMDEAAQNGALSQMATFAETKTLSYLQAVIKEVLRMHPPVSVILPREVPHGGAELGGYFFPEKTNVGCSAWAVHYNSSAVDRPTEFLPERWLQNGASEISTPVNFAFGGGTRACIGKNISILEISKVLPQIVRNYDITIEEPSTRVPGGGTWFVWPRYRCVIMPRKV